MNEDTIRSNSAPPDSVDVDGDGVGHDPVTETFRARFAPRPGPAATETNCDALSVAIVRTVAIVTNRDPVDMSPLFETVDSEALGEFVMPNSDSDSNSTPNAAAASTPTSSSAGVRDRPVEVRFSYEGCDVSVSSGGTVAVEDRGG